MSQPPENANQDNLKALWQGQDPEIPTMTAAAIRMLVKDNATRQRHYRAFGLGVAVFATGIWIWCAWTAPTQLVRVGDLVMLGWTPITIWMLYRRRPGRAPGADASAQGLLDFYRGEVVRQAPDLRLTALAMAPLVVGMALICTAIWRKLSLDHLARAWPIAALIVVWAVLFVFQLRRGRRRLAERLRDIDALRG